MNRCTVLPLGRALLCAAIVCTLSWPTLAQVRNLPATALAGTLQVTTPPEVLIDGKSERLAPGARIRSTHNLLVTPASLAGRPVPVRYLREPGGLVHDVWILSAAEAAQTDLPVITNIVTSADAAAGPRDDGKTPFDQLPKYPAR